jgi:hypothetical protein
VANDKAPYILLGTYQSLYKERYGKPPRINKYREKWAMQDVIDSVGYDRAKELLEYYFMTAKQGHPLSFFYYNFDKIDALKTEIDRDKLNRIRMLKETKEMVEENNEH